MRVLMGTLKNAGRVPSENAAAPHGHHSHKGAVRSDRDISYSLVRATGWVQ
jgi:hypothetical protein